MSDDIAITTPFLPASLCRKALLLCGLLLLPFTPLKGASFEEGVAAYDRGQYHDAYTIFYTLAELGHPDALNNLGTLYQTGKGVTKNYHYALKAYERAAHVGHINGAYNASNLTRLGIGTQKAMDRAYAWAILAARHGASDMIAYRDALEQKLTEQEKSSAYHLAEEWLEAIAPLELAVAWLLPSALSQPLPEHLKRLEKRRTMKEEPPPQMAATAPSLAVPPGFTALTPQGARAKTPIGLPHQPNLARETPPHSEESTPPLESPFSALFKEGYTVLKPLQEQKDELKESAPTSQEAPPSNERTYPTRLGQAGETLYRPQREGLAIPEGGVVLKPRRVIPPKELTLNSEIPLQDELNIIVTNLARAYNRPFSATFEALKALNPENIRYDEEHESYIISDPNAPLRFPAAEEI